MADEPMKCASLLCVKFYLLKTWMPKLFAPHPFMILLGRRSLVPTIGSMFNLLETITSVGRENARDQWISNINR